MKVLICGKGGCGKSTLAVLIAREFKHKGYNVILVDADESNRGLARLLGAAEPTAITDLLGGKKGAKDKMAARFSKGKMPVFTNERWYTEDIPEDFITRADGIKLITMGKIHHFGEGCACAVGALSRTFLSNLKLKKNEIVIVDTEAGVEHFGRGLDAGGDLALAVIDPSFESFVLAQKIEEMGKEAKIPVFFVLNKIDEQLEPIMSAHVSPEKIVSKIPQNQNIFMDALQGNALKTELEEIGGVCGFLENL